MSNTAPTAEELKSSIKIWSDLADSKEALALGLSHRDGDPSLIREAVSESREAANVAQSLRIQLATGINHCCCKNPPHPFNH